MEDHRLPERAVAASRQNEIKNGRIYVLFAVTVAALAALRAFLIAEAVFSTKGLAMLGVMAAGVVAGLALVAIVYWIYRVRTKASDPWKTFGSFVLAAVVSGFLIGFSYSGIPFLDMGLISGAKDLLRLVGAAPAIVLFTSAFLLCTWAAAQIRYHHRIYSGVAPKERAPELNRWTRLFAVLGVISLALIIVCLQLASVLENIPKWLALSVLGGGGLTAGFAGLAMLGLSYRSFIHAYKTRSLMPILRPIALMGVIALNVVFVPEVRTVVMSLWTGIQELSRVGGASSTLVFALGLAAPFVPVLIMAVSYCLSWLNKPAAGYAKVGSFHSRSNSKSPTSKSQVEDYQRVPSPSSPSSQASSDVRQKSGEKADVKAAAGQADVAGAGPIPFSQQPPPSVLRPTPTTASASSASSQSAAPSAQPQNSQQPSVNSAPPAQPDPSPQVQQQPIGGNNAPVVESQPKPALRPASPPNADNKNQDNPDPQVYDDMVDGDEGDDEAKNTIALLARLAQDRTPSPSALSQPSKNDPPSPVRAVSPDDADDGDQDEVNRSFPGLREGTPSPSGQQQSDSSSGSESESGDEGEEEEQVLTPDAIRELRSQLEQSLEVEEAQDDKILREKLFNIGGEQDPDPAHVHTQRLIMLINQGKQRGLLLDNERTLVENSLEDGLLAENEDVVTYFCQHNPEIVSQKMVLSNVMTRIPPTIKALLITAMAQHCQVEWEPEDLCLLFKYIVDENLSVDVVAIFGMLSKNMEVDGPQAAFNELLIESLPDGKNGDEQAELVQCLMKLDKGKLFGEALKTLQENPDRQKIFNRLLIYALSCQDREYTPIQLLARESELFKIAIKTKAVWEEIEKTCLKDLKIGKFESAQDFWEQRFGKDNSLRIFPFLLARQQKIKSIKAQVEVYWNVCKMMDQQIQEPSIQGKCELEVFSTFLQAEHYCLSSKDESQKAEREEIIQFLSDAKDDQSAEIEPILREGVLLSAQECRHIQEVARRWPVVEKVLGLKAHEALMQAIRDFEKCDLQEIKEEQKKEEPKKEEPVSDEDKQAVAVHEIMEQVRNVGVAGHTAFFNQRKQKREATPAQSVVVPLENGDGQAPTPPAPPPP